jgi:hypothetical protein
MLEYPTIPDLDVNGGDNFLQKAPKKQRIWNCISLKQGITGCKHIFSQLIDGGPLSIC